MICAATSVRGLFTTDHSTKNIDSAITGFQQGDPNCFRKIVERYQQDVATFCLRYVGSPDTARDLTQDVFFTLWKERKRYQHRGKLKAYLFTIARNRCLATLKHNRKLISLRADSDARTCSADPELLSRDLRRIIHKLHPNFAEVLILRYLEDMDLNAIAELTEQPLGTVKSRLHRALKQLKRAWHA